MVTEPGAHLRAALGYAARGMSVFPLLVGSKVPKWRAWEERATLDTELITRTWFGGRAPLNIGIACGPSKLIVVDLDVPKPDVDAKKPRPEVWAALGIVDGMGVLRHLADEAGKPWPATLTTRTPRGGVHLYFAAPAGADLGTSAGTVAWSVDVRARGGYAVGLGSVVDGRPYTLAPGSPTEPAPLPEWLHALIISPRPAPAPAPTGDGAALAARLAAAASASTAEHRWAVGALTAECKQVASTPAGSGTSNATLNRAAFKLGQLVGRQLLDEADVRQALTEAAALAGLTAYETERTIASGLRAGIASPRRRPRV